MWKSNTTQHNTTQQTHKNKNKTESQKWRLLLQAVKLVEKLRISWTNGTVVQKRLAQLSRKTIILTWIKLYSDARCWAHP